MRRGLLIVIFSIVLSTLRSTAQNPYYAINYDHKTFEAMVSAYGIEMGIEMYYSEQVKKILERYTAAEIAAAGIFTSKFLDRKALTDLGIWVSPTENQYYKRIYQLVATRIMPKIFRVAQMMIHSPQTAIYWGSYLFKICIEVENLCMQFESIVTNSTLSFRDLVFLKISPQFAPLFELTKMGGADFKAYLDGFGDIANHFTRESLRQDVTTLYNMGVSIANAGMTNAMNQLLGGASMNDIISGKVTSLVGVANGSYTFFKQLDGNLKNTLLQLVGGPQNVARLFDLSNYNITNWLTDYAREGIGQYYTQRWYIYRRDAGSQVLANYTPATDSQSILYGGEWIRITTHDPSFAPSSAQIALIKANSERYAGFSQSRVDQLNASNDGYRYDIEYNRYAYNIVRGDLQEQKAYAYGIRVTRSWDITEEVYEDVFDSYSMDLNYYCPLKHSTPLPNHLYIWHGRIF